ncbi:MAG: metallopeptidase family protein [candidate division Zixibacteria bacterium]|nr:metallopeptidase family protein [candidate division Zixibacteria bacterium]MCI0596538.1 metallopeptidase family protein [candidate division Zixibacteria bacterium]
MTQAEFELVAKEAIKGLPKEIREKIENVQIVVRDARKPKRGDDLDERELYGLYAGTPLPERRYDDSMRLPDTVILFKNNIEEEFSGDRAGMIKCIQETVLHELGHYFGFGEEDLEGMGIG